MSDVEVDATADTAANARSAALAQGHRKAFQELTERLVLAQRPAARRQPVIGRFGRHGAGLLGRR